MKRTVFKAVAAVLAVFIGLYLAFFCVFFCICLVNERRSGENRAWAMHAVMEGYFSDPMFPFDLQKSVEYMRRNVPSGYIGGSTMWYNRYPMACGLIDEKGEMLFCSESLLVVGEAASDSRADPDIYAYPDKVLFSVYLGDRITDEQRRALRALYPENAELEGSPYLYYGVRSASFAFRDGAPVPVSAVVVPFGSEAADGAELTLTFSELPAEKTYVSGENGVVMQLRFFVPEFRQKKYAPLRASLEKTAGIVKTQGIDAIKSGTGARTRGLLRFRTEIVGTVTDQDGAEYCICIVSEYDGVQHIFGNEDRRFLIRHVTYFFAAAAAVSAAAAALFAVKKGRREEARRLLTVSVAHELKTPVAVMQNQCECLAERVAPEKDEKYLRTILAQTDRLSEILAKFGAYEAAAQGRQPEAFSLSDTLRREAEKYRAFAESKGAGLAVSADDVRIRGDEAGISLVIDNFLSNAIRYAEGDKNVSVLLVRKRRGFRLSVYNPCGGIPNKEKRRIWKPFYRIDGARTDGGSGLGLAICAVILKKYRYRYGFVNENGGVTFYFAARKGRVK